MSNNANIHTLTDVQSADIGAGTRIWQYVVVLPDARIGHDCNICSHCFIENDVVVGDRVTVKCGVQLWDGLRISDDVFIGPNVTFTNDNCPASGNAAFERLPTFVEAGASIGAGAVILPGLRIGTGAFVAAGSVVPQPASIVSAATAEVRQEFDIHAAPREVGVLLVLLAMCAALALRLPVYDTQCGAKVMHRKAVEAIHPSLRIADMAFDINLLYSLKHAGYRVLEVPTEWTDKIGSKVTLFRTSLTMFLSVIRIRLIYSPFYRWLRPLRPLETWIYRKLRAPQPLPGPPGDGSNLKTNP